MTTEPTPPALPELPRVRVLRFGEGWGTPDPASPLDKFPPELVERARAWVRGDIDTMDPELSTFMRQQYTSAVNEISEKCKRVDAAVETFTGIIHTCDNLGDPMRLAEAYSKGYDGGYRRACDQFLAELQQIRVAGSPSEGV